MVFVPVHSILHGVSPTLILARDEGGSLAEAFLEIGQKISKETYAPQRQEVMYLDGTGDKCRELISLGLADLHLSSWAFMSALCQPGLVREEDGWGIAGTCGMGLCMLVQCWWEGKIENVKEIG